MTKLQDQVIWITGASSGIGEALAQYLSPMPVKLILSARRAEELERVKQSCSQPDHIEILPLDLTEYASHAEKAQQAIDCFGRVDVLINNGGISQRSLVADTTFAVDQRLIEVNYLGTVSLTKSILPHMLERGSGHLAVVTSLTGVFGSPYRSGYAASKHALHGFFDSLRAELENKGIRATIAAPGFVQTQVSVNALVGDGSKANVMDDAQANGISAEKCARAIVRAISKNKREIYVGREAYGAYVRRYLPGLFAWMIKRVKVR